MKTATRLPEPNKAERTWFREAIAYAPDLFSEPTFHTDDYEFERGKAIYPAEKNAALSYGRTKLLQKYARPHPSVWVRRLDLFLLTTDGEIERNYTANLAAVERRATLQAHKIIAENLTEGMTVEGQTCWEQVYELAVDILYTSGAEQVFVSQFLQNLCTNELHICNPIETATAFFTKERLQLKGGSWEPMSTRQRTWMRGQCQLTEWDNLTQLRLNRHGFIEKTPVTIQPTYSGEAWLVLNEEDYILNQEFCPLKAQEWAIAKGYQIKKH